MELEPVLLTLPFARTNAYYHSFFTTCRVSGTVSCFMYSSIWQLKSSSQLINGGTSSGLKSSSQLSNGDISAGLKSSSRLINGDFKRKSFYVGNSTTSELKADNFMRAAFTHVECVKNTKLVIAHWNKHLTTNVTNATVDKPYPCSWWWFLHTIHSVNYIDYMHVVTCEVEIKHNCTQINISGQLDTQQLASCMYNFTDEWSFYLLESPPTELLTLSYIQPVADNISQKGRKRRWNKHLVVRYTIINSQDSYTPYMVTAQAINKLIAQKVLH